MLSIFIPTYHDPYLQKTIDSLLTNAEGDIEVVAVLDGFTPEIPIKEDKRVKIITLSENKGMRGAINAGLAKTQGEFVMKCDSHCIFAPGYDKVLTKDCAENWIMIPRRYRLHEATWTKVSPIVDYHYLTFPEESDQHYGYSLQVAAWPRRRIDDVLIDDVMTFQGSCWVANKKYFMEHVGYMDDRLTTYGTFAQDQQEIGLKYWLNGGEVKVNKKTWYAHLSKRGYHYDKGVFSRLHKRDKYHISGNNWGTKHWMNNEEPNMKHTFTWFVEKFWPIPTWPDNWQEIWANHLNSIG